jgi:hypothetical protein
LKFYKTEGNIGNLAENVINGKEEGGKVKVKVKVNVKVKVKLSLRFN